MSTAPWYKCYPRDFNDGMVGLTLEERGAYVTILNVIYARGGPVPDDSGYFRALLCCSGKAWIKVRAALLVKRKIFEVSLNGEPSLMNRRAAAEIETFSETSQKFSAAGRRGGQTAQAKAKENKGLAEARLEPGSTNRDTDTDIEKKEPEAVASARSQIDQPDAAAWATAKILLTEREKLSEDAAGKFFGQLLARNRLEPRDMLASLATASLNGTPKPRDYLAKAAANISKRRSDQPPKRVGFV